MQHLHPPSGRMGQGRIVRRELSAKGRRASRARDNGRCHTRTKRSRREAVAEFWATTDASIYIYIPHFSIIVYLSNTQPPQASPKLPPVPWPFWLKAALLSRRFSDLVLPVILPLWAEGVEVRGVLGSSTFLREAQASFGTQVPPQTCGGHRCTRSNVGRGAASGVGSGTGRCNFGRTRRW